jgi:hypothetical protein
MNFWDSLGMTAGFCDVSRDDLPIIFYNIIGTTRQKIIQIGQVCRRYRRTEHF